MLTVCKYELKPGMYAVKMPDGAELLTVATQNGQPHLWAKVDTNRPMVARKILTVGTGHEIKPDIAASLRYLGTSFGVEGWMLKVWHSFEMR